VSRVKIYLKTSLFPRIFPVFRLGFLIVAETFGKGVGGVLVLALEFRVFRVKKIPHSIIYFLGLIPIAALKYLPKNEGLAK